MKKICFLFALLLVACGTQPQSEVTSDLTVMSFNMRYDNPEDGENNWQYRHDRIAELIHDVDADLVGTQELLAHQYDKMCELLPEYVGVGVGREDGDRKGEYTAIFYHRDRFTLLDSGYFWLSETPEVAGSKGWDGACERMATWVLLSDMKGHVFLMMNTHLDHVGVEARREGVQLLIERLADLCCDRPVILTGDFNADAESDVVAHVQQGDWLVSSHVAAAERAGLEGSFSDYGEIPVMFRPLIDYIFVGDFTVDYFEVMPDHNDEGYYSDHSPVMARLRFKPFEYNDVDNPASAEPDAEPAE